MTAYRSATESRSGLPLPEVGSGDKRRDALFTGLAAATRSKRLNHKTFLKYTDKNCDLSGRAGNYLASL